MPWCPRCDEVFPEGPACPRCRAALVEVSGVTQAEEHPPLALPELRVPRRLRRSLAPPRPVPPPPRHLIAVAVSLVLVAGGFVLGRMSAVPADSPVLRSAPMSNVKIPAPGAITFLRPGAAPGEYVLVRATLRTGRAQVLGTFALPPARGASGPPSVHLAALRSSVAVVVSGDGRASIAAFPAGRPPVLWLRGQEAAWEDADTLLVRDGGRVTRWSFVNGPESGSLEGSWRRLVQTADGAALEGPTQDGVALHLSHAEGPVRVLDLPPGASTIAVAPAGVPALVTVDDAPALWDGTRLEPADVDPAMRSRGAAFSRDGSRIAIVLTARDEGARSEGQQLAVLDREGSRIDLQRLPGPRRTASCDAVPSWDAAGTWVFLGPGDRSVQALEVGGRRYVAEVSEVGCGLAWTGDGRDA